MKKIITEETVKVEMWEAEDGERFKTESECEKHERKNDLMKRINNVPHDLISHNDIFPTGSGFDQLVMFYPRDIGDATILREWCIFYNIDNPFTLNGMVGKTLVIGDAYTENENADLEDIIPDYFYGELETIEDYIGGFAKTIHYFEQEMLEKNKENAK